MRNFFFFFLLPFLSRRKSSASRKKMFENSTKSKSRRPGRSAGRSRFQRRMKCNAVKYSSRETQLRFRENTSYTQRGSLVGTLEIEKKKKEKEIIERNLIPFSLFPFIPRLLLEFRNLSRGSSIGLLLLPPPPVILPVASAIKIQAERERGGRGRSCTGSERTESITGGSWRNDVTARTTERR